jgi:hypothetical protein
MKLIDLYASEVGRRLPARNRSDIENELRSTLLDMLEDRVKQEGREADDRMVKALLQEYGSPEKVASAYHTERYLIGPRMYPTFIMVFKIVGAVLITLGIIGMGVKLGQNGTTSLMAGKIILESLAEIFSSLFQAFAIIIFILAVLERFLPAEVPSPDTWDPSELEMLSTPDTVNTTERIFTIVFTVLFMVVLNFYPNLVGVYFRMDTGWKSFPILSPTFFNYILFFDLIWIMQITLAALVLRDGIWTRNTRIFEIILNVINLVMLVVVLVGPSVIQIPLDVIQSSGIALNNTSAVAVQTAAIQGFRAVLGLVAGLVLITTGRRVYDLVK